MNGWSRDSYPVWWCHESGLMRELDLPTILSANAAAQIAATGLNLELQVCEGRLGSV
jgi:hypothetical protein